MIFLEKINNSPDTYIPPDSIVKIYDIKSHTEINYMSSPNSVIKIKKIDKNHYINLVTGELLEFNKTENRAQNLIEVSNTVKKIRNLINHNYIGGKNEMMFTLTPAKNMTDIKEFYKVFVLFNKRFTYYCDKNNIGKYEYLSIIEPQGRGAWHSHLLLRFDKEVEWLKNSVIRDIWGQGWVTVKRINNNIDNLGAYLSAYLANMEYSKDNVKILKSHGVNINNLPKKDIIVDGQNKKFLKGARLYLYPTGMQMFRKSKGIEYPPVYKGRYKIEKERLGLKNPHYKSEVQISKNGKIINRNVFEQYKKSSLI